MGSIYRAFDLLNDRPCAVKEFRLAHLPTEEDVTHYRGMASSSYTDRKQPRITREKAAEQFQREAKMLARLEFPNLPKVTDYFAVGDDQYLVMTLIEGRDLAQIMDEAKEPLPQDRVLGWMRQVLDALAYCHREGVVHRDVKPANVIVTDGGEAFLVDFGIAKPETADGETTIGARATTPGYSPPEQYGGQGQTDIRSDIYALGATMYALLTGRQPMDAIQRLDREMPGVRRLRPDISPRVDRAIWRALALRRDDRFRNVKEMTDALYGNSFVAVVTAATKAIPARTRYPLGVAVLGCILVLLTAFGTVVTNSMVQRGRAGQETPTPEGALPGGTAPSLLETASLATSANLPVETPAPSLVSPVPAATETALHGVRQSSKTSTVTVTRLTSEPGTLTPTPSATRLLPSRTMTPLTVTPSSPSPEHRSTATQPPSPTATQAPPPPTATRVPPQPTATQAPPQPTATRIPPQPTATQAPPRPTATRIPPQPTATQAPPQPTATRIPPQPTATQAPPQPTATQAPPQPTATRVDTPILPTVPVKTVLPTRDPPTIAPPDT